MAVCIAFACSNRSEAGCRLFPFPWDEAEKLDLWIDLINKAGKGQWTPTKDNQICEFHFEKDQFNAIGDLAEDAIPTIFFPFTRKFTRGKEKQKPIAPPRNEVSTNSTIPALRVRKTKSDSLLSDDHETISCCRLCAKPTNKLSVNLFEKNFNYDINIFEFLSKLFEIVVKEEDELPKSICCRCDRKLDDIVGYRKECKLADVRLKRLHADGNVEFAEEKDRLSIVKRETDDSKFEFVCADDEQAKCLVDLVTIEMREIKDEPVAYDSDFRPNINEDLVKALTTEVKKQEIMDMDDDYEPESEAIADSNITDSDDDYPLKPKSKPQPKTSPNKWQCVDCEEYMASRTKLREHRKTCLFVGSEMSKKKREKIKKEVKRENKPNMTRQRRVPPTDDEKRKMIDEILNPTKDEEDESKLAQLLRPPKPTAPKHQWKCVDCEEMLPSRSKLKKHRQTCAVIGTPMSKKKKRTDEAPIPCEYCGKMLSCKMGYKQHLKYCIGFDKSEVEGKALDDPIEKEAEAEDGEDDRVVCHICGKKILHRSTLAAHIRFHTKEKPHKCAICSKSYYTSSELREHAGSHDPVKSFICKVCNKAFSARSYLRKHMVVHDPRFKNIQCPFCPKKFIRKCEIQMHLMSHTGYSPNECQICQQKFRFSWELKKHLQKNHGIVDETATATAALEQTYNQQQMELSSPQTDTNSSVRAEENSNASSEVPTTSHNQPSMIARPLPHPLLSEGLGIGMQTLYNLHSQIEENRYHHNFPYL